MAPPPAPRASGAGSLLGLLHEAGRLAKAAVVRVFSLQGRIANLARELAGAAGATVHLRTQDGLQSL
ncbi:MAG TPA: hypothetical protein VH083_12575, partial [Myxococcales bacterium]|nr:hypothetical protein [Myxococcales bacterium]